MSIRRVPTLRCRPYLDRRVQSSRNHPADMLARREFAVRQTALLIGSGCSSPQAQDRPKMIRVVALLVFNCK